MKKQDNLTSSDEQPQSGLPGFMVGIVFILGSFLQAFTQDVVNQSVFFDMPSYMATYLSGILFLIHSLMKGSAVEARS